MLAPLERERGRISKARGRRRLSDRLDENSHPMTKEASAASMRRRGNRVILETSRHRLVLALIRNDGALQLRYSNEGKRMAWLSPSQTQEAANEDLSLFFLPGGVTVGDPATAQATVLVCRRSLDTTSPTNV